MKWLDKLPWPILIVAAVFLGLAPFNPEPHLVEKTRMLMNGNLRAPIDIFDLVMHSTPAVLLLLKIARLMTHGRNA